MTRIFLTLATLNAVALGASFVLGVAYMPSSSSEELARTPEQLVAVNWHIVVGLFAAVFTLFVHCLIFTYFLGTGRWVKEVARAYDLPDADMPRATREFKREAFPPALFGMLSAIATAAAGGAAQTETWPWWIHAILAVVTLFLNARAFVIEYRAVSNNGQVMDRLLAEVIRRREAVGSPDG